jgi:hypothetical protein
VAKPVVEVMVEVMVVVMVVVEALVEDSDKVLEDFDTLEDLNKVMEA